MAQGTVIRMLLVLVMFLCLVCAKLDPRSPIHSQQTLLPPLQDPFYRAPDNIRDFKSGAILRYRPVPSPIAFARVGKLNLKAAYQILYKTTNALGGDEANVVTLLVPHNADPTKHLAYQVPYDTAYENCAVSYAFQQGSETSNSTAIDIFLITAALEKGWYVSTADYEGPLAAVVVGPQAGTAVLDSVRAVIRSASFSKLSKRARNVLWGYSGGALAVEWAAELHESYASELKFAGAALGGLTPNFTSVLESINRQSSAGLIPISLLGIAKVYSNMSAWLDGALKPSKVADFKYPLKHCAVGDLSHFSHKNMYDYFKDGAKALTQEVPQSMLKNIGIMGGHGTPNFPLYAYKGVQDQTSVIQDTDKLVKKFCNKGVKISYVRNQPSNHVTEAILGAPDALRWLTDRLNGLPVAPRCNTLDTVLTSLRPRDVLILGEIVYTALLGLLSLPIGPL